MLELRVFIGVLVCAREVGSVCINVVKPFGSSYPTVPACQRSTCRERSRKQNVLPFNVP